MAENKRPGELYGDTEEPTNKRSRTIQLAAYQAIYFKFKAEPDYELPWFKNLTVTAYRGTPQPQTFGENTKICQRKNILDLLMPGLTSYAIRRGGFDSAFDGANDLDEPMPSTHQATVEDENMSSDKPNKESDLHDPEDEDNEDHEEEADWFGDVESEDDDIDEDEADESGSEDDDPKSERVGDIRARLMRRGEIRSDFWRDMEEPSQDTAALAFDVFDRYGCLREEFITGSKKGTGIWAHELDTGNILQIESVNVELKSRRQGIAAMMLRILIDEAQKMDKWFRFALAWPTFLNSSVPRGLPKEDFDRVYDEGVKTAVGLFRKAGFRRVGTTEWFAFAVKPDHPSHNLAATADGQEAEELSELQKLEDSLERSRVLRPWRMATLIVSDQFKGYSDDDVKRLLSLRGVNNPSAVVLAQTKYGCTCAKCFDGYLSPRMATQIKHGAEWNFDMGEDMGDMMWDVGDDGFMAPSSWQYLPAQVRPYMKSNKSNREGHRRIYGHIVTALTENRAPTIPVILAVLEDSGDWPPYTRNFTQRAGIPGIDAILRGLFDEVKAKDPKVANHINTIAYSRDFPMAAEGGEFAHMPDILLEEAQYEVSVLEDLPMCRNDGEFGFVLGMLLGKTVGASMEEYWGGPGVE